MSSHGFNSQLWLQLSGFRRGILNVAMRPAVLRSAVAQGGSTRRIKLDHSVGMDEVCFFLTKLPKCILVCGE